MRLGSLCSGIGGLDLAVEGVFGAELAWCAEIDPAASRVLEARFGVPNLGDFRDADPEPVDVLCAGFPCQPVSTAGRRSGVDDERWLFDDILALVGRMGPRPRLLVFENVLGLLSANGGDAMARVVQGLAASGYVGSWRVVRASDAGACHQRARVFIVAADASGSGQLQERHGDEVANAGRPRPVHDSRLRGSGDADQRPVSAALAATEGARSVSVGNRGATPAHPDGGSAGRNVGAAPGPQATDAGRGGTVVGDRPADGAGPGDRAGRRATPAHPDGAGGEARSERPGRGDARRLQPLDGGNPTPADAERQGLEGSQQPGIIYAERGPTRADATHVGRQRGGQPRHGWPGPADCDWGPYEAAVRRWEHVLGRPAPAPVDDRGRLNPWLVEWMMGYPEGWVCDVIDRRTDALRMLGNAVVPQQAAMALRALAGEP